MAPGWLSRRRFPPIGDCPIAVAVVSPVRRPNDLLLRRDERVHGTHPVLLRSAARDTHQRDHAVVYDDAELRPGHGGAFKDCIDMCQCSRCPSEDVRWNWTFVANGASCDTLKVRCFGMWSAGSGPCAARVDRLSAVSTGHDMCHFQLLALQDMIQTVENDDLVRRIDVEALSEWKRDWIVVQRRVGGRVVRQDGGVREPCHEFLHIPDALRPPKRKAEARIVPGKTVGAASYT